MAQSVRLALVGFGRIARGFHLPAINATDGVALAATVDPATSLDGTPSFDALDDLLAARLGIDAVAFCTPAAGRRALVERALGAGLHVLLEKPPVASITEMAVLAQAARDAGRTLFATWHARFGVGVEPARALLANATVRAVQIDWKEDVRTWHPGQDWIWKPGGFGVFDPGINALSVATAILPRPFFLQESDLFVPANRAAPIAAALAFVDAAGVPIRAAFDFREPDPRIWTVRVDTDAGTINLSDGGARLSRDGTVLVEEPGLDPAGLSRAEYPAIYRRFLALIASGSSDADILPLLHTADALALGRRHVVAPFHDDPTRPG